MQHGTARELVAEAIGNATAVLEDGRRRNGWPVSDVIIDLHKALAALEFEDVDQRGAFGPDYPTPEEFASRFDVGPVVDRVTDRAFGV